MGNAASCIGANNKKQSKNNESSSNSDSTSESKPTSSKSSVSKTDKKADDSGVGSSYDSESEGKKPYYKMLLVGAGEAGKSTFFKIVTNKTKSLFTDSEELKEFKDTIFDNTLDAVTTIINKCNELKEYIDENNNVIDCRIAEERKEHVDVLLTTRKKGMGFLTTQQVEAIESLVQDEGFMNCLTKLRSLYYISDGAPYFIENIKRIGQEDYVPNFKDVLKCRDKTIGVTHEDLPFEFKNKKVIVDLYDVGGQRTERKAWRNIFVDVSAIIFVMAISEFDMKCVEDNATDRLIESLIVLRALNESKSFAKTPVLLLFTKVDQLEMKLNEGKKFYLVAPEDCAISFKSYDGDNTIEDIKKYILYVCRLQINDDTKMVTAFKNLVGEDVSFQKEFEELIGAAEANRGR